MEVTTITCHLFTHQGFDCNRHCHQDIVGIYDDFKSALRKVLGEPLLQQTDLMMQTLQNMIEVLCIVLEIILQSSPLAPVDLVLNFRFG